MSLLVAVGCGSKDGGSSKSEPAAKQELRLNIGADPEGFDPSTASYLDTFNVLTALWAPLYRLTGDQSELTPFLADGLPEISKDGLTYTIKLRDDAVWSDDTPVTADDVVFGVRRSLDPELGAYYAGFLKDLVGACEYMTTAKADGEKSGDDAEECSGLKTDRKPESIGVRAVDEHTVEFKLERPVPWFDQLLTLGVTFPQPQKAFEKAGTAEKFFTPENIVTNGPFTLKSFKRRDRIVVEKNDKWWGADGVKLESIVFRVIPESTTANKLFEEGDLDAGFTRTMVPTAEIDEWKTKDEYRDVSTTSTTYLYLNSTNDELKDPKVRQGISLAIDRKTLVERVLKKGDRPLDTIIPDNIPGYDTVREATQDFLPAEQAPDIDKAKEALEEGGWKAGTELSFYYASDGSNTQAVAESIQSDLAKVDVKVKLVPLPGDQLQVPGIGVSPVEEKVDLLLQGWAADYLDAQNFYQLFTCDTVEGGLNAANYCDEEFDKVYETALGTVDQDARVELYRQLEGMLTGPDGGMPVAPLYQDVDNTLVQEWVKGFELLPSAFLYYEDIEIESH